MIIKSLQFENFRNLINNSITPCESVNVFYGDNAQGKTNLLEVIWLFCGGHSFRNNKENELIKFNENYYKLNIEFNSFGRDQTAQIIYSKNKKQVFINEIEKSSSSYLTEIFSAVVFSPDHLELVKDKPSKRRKFLDAAICQQKIKYALSLAKYQKVLNQRNMLLKDMYKHRELKETLFIWDDILAKQGAVILKERLEYIEKLKIIAKEFHKGISNNKEELDIIYESSIDIKNLKSEEEIKEILIKEFENHQEEDIRYGHTSVGPHRDDISILINGISSKIYGSQGQQRSAVLSLKLSEAQLLYEKNEEKPVILLDDVLSELDKNRQDYLLNKIDGYQVFVTSCEQNEKLKLDNGKLFYINNGVIK